jgi:predicted NBD/HSP70 family sugar kinase
MKRARKVKIKQSLVAEVEADLVTRLRVGGSIPRVQLARELNLAPSTVGIYVDRLISEGLLCEGPRVARDVGRPATLLALNPDGGRFVGVDIEARNALLSVVDFSQKPLEQVCLKLRKSETAETILDKIVEAIEELRAASPRPLLGVGVGVPGVVDPRNGVAVHYQHIKGWQNVPLAQSLNERLRVPVFLENNIRSMAMAEMWFGAGLAVENFICLGVRSGIGAGIVTQRRLEHGHDNMAGEIGGWQCPTSLPGKAPSATLAFETLEALASMSAIARRLNEAFGTDDDWTAEQLLEAHGRGDRVVCDCLQSAAEACGWALGQLNLALNVELIVLAGPLTMLGDDFLRPMSEAIRSCSMPELHSAMPRVESSQLGPFVGALGAAALAVQQWKPVR